MKTLLSLLLVVLTFLGILDAGYISYEKWSGRIPPCNLHFQCGTVLNSEWANIGPFPLAALGLLFYGVFFGLSLLWFFEKKHFTIFGKPIPTQSILLAQGTFGIFFSAYLIYIMAVVLHAWCFYCLISASICTLLFITTDLIYFIEGKK
jgi:uncharacterized membrane protein